MAGDLRNLTVRLSLDNMNFQNNLAGANRALSTLRGEFRATQQGMGGFDNEIERTRSQIDILTRTITAQEGKVQELSRLYEQAKQTTGENSKATQSYASQLNSAVAELNRLDGQLKQTESNMQKMENTTVPLSDRMEQLGNKLQNAGMQIGIVFGGISTALTGALKSTVEESANFEQQMANIQAVSGATGDEMKTLSKLAIDMGAATKYSSVEAGKGIEELIKAGVSLKDIVNGGLEGALNLATAGELDLGDAAEIASTALNAFQKDNLSVADAANMLAGAANASATDVGELKFGLSAVSAVASGVGLSFKDTTTALAAFAQNGLKGQDAGTSLKTMLMNLTPQTKEQYTAFEDLGLMTFNNAKALEFLNSVGVKPASNSTQDLTKAIQGYIMHSQNAKKWTAECEKTFRGLGSGAGFMSSAFYDSNGNLKSMADISGILQNALKNMNAEQRQTTLYTIFGSDAIRAGNILYKEGAQGINDMWKAMSNVTAADVAKTKMDTLKGSMEQLSGSFDTAKQVIGDQLAPAIRKIADVLTAATNKFNDLSPGMQKTIAIGLATIAVFAGITAIIGGALAAVSAVSAGIGALTPIIAELGISIAAAGGATGILASALAVLTGPIGVGIAAAVGIGILAYDGYKKATEDSIQVTDRFGEGVSKSTKKALDAYFQLSDSAQKEIRSMSINNENMTKEHADHIVQIYNSMKDQVLQAIDKQNSERINRMTAFFKNSSVLTEQEEAKIIAMQTAKGEEQKKAVEDANKKINEIVQKALQEKRQLTQQEEKQIATLREQMNNSAVQSMSKSAQEQKAILEGLKANASTITAQQTAEVVKNSAEARDKTIADAKKQYNDNLKTISDMRDNAKTITADQADAMIRESAKARDTTIQHAKDMHNQVVSEAKAQAGEHANQINYETGTIKSNWDVFTGDMGKKAKETADAIAKNLHVDNPESIGKSIIDGLKRGMDLAFPDLIGETRSLANSISKTVSGELQINSPSKVMMKIGAGIPEGLSLGMTNNVSQVLGAANSLAKASIPNIEDTSFTSKVSTGQTGSVASASPATVQLVIDGRTLGEVMVPHVDTLQNKTYQTRLYMGGVRG